MAKNKLDNIYRQAITGKGAGKAQKSNPIGVKLTAEEIEHLDDIAGHLGVTRHQVLQFAVRNFIERYLAGFRPKTATKTILTLDSKE